jgi:hypothetical protein
MIKSKIIFLLCKLKTHLSGIVFVKIKYPGTEYLGIIPAFLALYYSDPYKLKISTKYKENFFKRIPLTDYMIGKYYLTKCSEFVSLIICKIRMKTVEEQGKKTINCWDDSTFIINFPAKYFHYFLFERAF